jgi:integrase
MPTYPGRRRGTQRVTVYHEGRQHEWIVEGSRHDAEAFEVERRRELRSHTAAERRTVPIFSVFCLEEYETHARRHLGGRTWKLARRYLVAQLMRSLGSVRMDEFGPLVIERYKTERLGARPRGRPLKPSTINSELRALGTILRWAREERGVPVPEFRMRYLPEGGKPRTFAWTEAEVQRLLGSARAVHAPLALLFQFLLNTGCRKGEGIAAEWSWIDWDARLLRIPVTEYWSPKSKRPREVPLPASLLTMLRRLPRRARTIFPSVLGVPYQSFPNQLSRRAIRRARLRGSAHTTRHTFASHFLHAQPDLFLLGQLLGHTTARVTELYAHMLPGHLDRARGAVDLAPTLAADSGRRRRRA